MAPHDAVGEGLADGDFVALDFEILVGVELVLEGVFVLLGVPFDRGVDGAEGVERECVEGEGIG